MILTFTMGQVHVVLDVVPKPKFCQVMSSHLHLLMNLPLFLNWFMKRFSSQNLLFKIGKSPWPIVTLFGCLSRWPALWWRCRCRRVDICLEFRVAAYMRALYLWSGGIQVENGKGYNRAWAANTMPGQFWLVIVKRQKAWCQWCQGLDWQQGQGLDPKGLGQGQGLINITAWCCESDSW